VFPAPARRWSQTPETASSRSALVALSSAVALQRCECAGDLATSAGLILPAESRELHPAEYDLPLSYRCSLVSVMRSIFDSRGYEFLCSRCLLKRPCAGEWSDRRTFGIEPGR